MERVVDLSSDQWMTVSGEIIAIGATTRWLGVASSNATEAYHRVREAD